MGDPKKSEILKKCEYAVRVVTEKGKFLDASGVKCNYNCPFIPPDEDQTCESPVLVSLEGLVQLGAARFHPLMDHPGEYDTPQNSQMSYKGGYLCQRWGQPESELKEWYAKYLKAEAEEDEEG